jgi:hypothetical protein
VPQSGFYKCRTLAQTAAYRADFRAENWFGYAVADVLGIKIAHGANNNPADIARVKQILATWKKNKVIDIEKKDDEYRSSRAFIIPGPWNGDASTSRASDDDFIQ